MVLLDTCALIWWTLDPEKLSQAAAAACEDIHKTGGVISSISIWEIGIKIKKGSIDIGISLEEYVSRLKQIANLDIVPVDEDIWVKSITIDWAHKDPADRAIVATAALRDLPIVSKDSTIKKFYSNVIW
jgi:PIN domain nuclease of toxin-antitoxin system